MMKGENGVSEEILFCPKRSQSSKEGDEEILERRYF